MQCSINVCPSDAVSRTKHPDNRGNYIYFCELHTSLCETLYPLTAGVKSRVCKEYVHGMRTCGQVATYTLDQSSYLGSKAAYVCDEHAEDYRQLINAGGRYTLTQL